METRPHVDEPSDHSGAGQKVQFMMKYYILHAFITSTPFKENPLIFLKDLYIVELQTNFYVNLSTSLRGVMNTVFNVYFIHLQLKSD